MHTTTTIRDIIMSDHSIPISIRGVSDLIADYAQLTPGDRLCMFIDKNRHWRHRSESGDDRCQMTYNSDSGQVHLVKHMSESNVIGFINVACRIILGEWVYPFGRESWSANLTMERLKKAEDYPILRKLYSVVMQQDQ